MNPGEFNRRVRIEKRVRDHDEAGQPVDAWETVCERWASIRGQTGMGSISRMQDNVPVMVSMYSIRLRYVEGIEPDMRVIYRDQVFRILKVNMDFGGREYTDLVCETGARD